MTLASRSTMVQCQKPAGLGASGSKQETTKERVPCGAPDQCSSGEMLSPIAVRRRSISSPSRRSSEAREKLVTLGRWS